MPRLHVNVLEPRAVDIQESLKILHGWFGRRLLSDLWVRAAA